MKKPFDWSRWLAWLWIVFTLALATWQFIFQLRIISNPEILVSGDHDTKRYIRMVHYENITLIVSLIAGGAALFLLLRRERRKTQVQQEFFATFTHEIKTSLTAIKLRAESLQNTKAKDFKPWDQEDLLKGLHKLEVQLENSLFLAGGSQDRLLTERLNLRDVLLSLGPQVDLQVHLQKNCWINADRRAIESIIKNILMNATQHGKADNLWIEPLEDKNSGSVKIQFRDDGVGSKSDESRLGELFYRPLPSSGNGIGLYLLRNLTRRMGGDAHFASLSPKGFQVTVILPGSVHG